MYVQFTPVIHIIAHELHTCSSACAVPRYPKSTIDIKCLLSLQAAIRALKKAENCPPLHWWPLNFLHPIQTCPGRFFCQFRSARLIGRAALCSCHGFLHDSSQARSFGQEQTFYTTVQTQNHSCAIVSSCGTRNGSIHGDFAWHVASRSRAQLRIVYYVYTATCSYYAIRGYPHCCTRVYRYVYSLPPSYTSQRVDYTAVLQFVQSHRYPKSTIDSQSLSLSLQADLHAFQRLENCPFLTQSQKWGRNNGRIRKRRKGGESGTRQQKVRRHRWTKRKKFQRGRLIYRKEGTKGFIEAGYIVWCG